MSRHNGPSVYLDTEYSGCSAEYSPFHSHLLALGLYQIVPDDDDNKDHSHTQANAVVAEEQDHSSPKTKRLGRVLLLDTSSNSFQELSRVDMPAVLDMKWTLWKGRPTLAIANAEGGVALYRYNEAERVLEPEQLSQYAPKSTLSLSLEWSTRKHPSETPELVVSNSAGTISILSGPSLETTEEWEAHTFEPWIAAWDAWSSNTIYTGGDDSLMKMWDRRQGFDAPVLQNKRFDAGVTAIQTNVFDEHLVAVGSYDANLRIFDKRNLRRPLLEQDVGGGIWRVKWHPHASRKHDLLVACMHDGFKVVNVNQETDIEVSTVNQEHESMAYGADWEPEGGSTVASASFYDHAARIWQA